MRLKLLLKV